MREFSVFVMGIAAFVEDYRRVVAVNASRPMTLTLVKEEGGHSEDVTVPAHFPYVRVPFNHVDVDTQQRFAISQDWDISAAPGAFPSDPGNPNPMIRQTLVRFLSSHEVILPVESDTPPSVDLTPLNQNGIPIAADRHSALWLPSLDSMGAKKTKIDPVHIVKDPNPDAVAAYIRFPRGRISTATPTDFRFVSVTPVDGKKSGSLNRAVAQLMACKMSVPDGAFVVSCRDYRAVGALPPFEIKYKAGIANPWMVFASTSLEDALQLPSVEEQFGIDHHFRLVYGLAEGPVGADDIALPKSITPESGAKPLGTGRCVPPLLKGGSTGGI